MEIVVTESYNVGASYEGVQTEGDCSANLLGNNSQQAFPWLASTQCRAVRLARLAHNQEVTGSNPVTATWT
jgi:hypothetical protein